MPLKMPLAQGYVDLNKALDKVEKDGEYSILFSSFYDSRQGNLFKGCSIDIEMIK